MATKKRTPEPKEAWELNRPRGGPSGPLRQWYEDAVHREGRRREPAIAGRLWKGLPEYSEKELVVLASVARSLSVDPLALLLDAAVTALHNRCEPRPSAAGRRPNFTRQFQDARVVIEYRGLIAASRAAAETRTRAESERREAITSAVAQEQTRLWAIHDEETVGTRANDETARTVRGRQAQDMARKWLSVREPIVKALLEKFPRGRGRTMTAEESADELLALVGWARADIDRIIALKKVVADRSTLRRKRARAVAATFYELRRDSKND